MNGHQQRQNNDFMSVVRQDGSQVIDDEAYRANQAKIAEARAYIEAWEAMNEEGREKYKIMESELERKIREGEEAKRMLRVLKEKASGQSLLPQVQSDVESMPAARIEEVRSPQQVNQWPSSQSFHNTSYVQSASHYQPRSEASGSRNAQHHLSGAEPSQSPAYHRNMIQPHSNSSQKTTGQSQYTQHTRQTGSGLPSLQQQQWQHQPQQTYQQMAHIQYSTSQRPSGQMGQYRTSVATPHQASASTSAFSVPLVVENTSYLPPSGTSYSSLAGALDLTGQNVAAGITNKVAGVMHPTAGVDGHPPGPSASGSTTVQVPTAQKQRHPDTVLNRLEDFITQWAPSAPPMSSCDIPGTPWKAYKDASAQISIEVLDNGGERKRVAWHALKAQEARMKSEQRSGVHPSAQARGVPSPAAVYRPHSYRSTVSSTGKRSIPATVPSTSSLPSAQSIATAAVHAQRLPPPVIPAQQAPSALSARPLWSTAHPVQPPSSAAVHSTRSTPDGPSQVVPNTMHAKPLPSAFSTKPPSVVPSIPISPPTIIALPDMTRSSPSVSSSGNGYVRTPSQADKKHLARDILRALGSPFVQKRSRPDDMQRSTHEPASKKHVAVHPEPANAMALVSAPPGNSAPAQDRDANDTGTPIVQETVQTASQSIIDLVSDTPPHSAIVLEEVNGLVTVPAAQTQPSSTPAQPASPPQPVPKQITVPSSEGSGSVAVSSNVASAAPQSELAPTVVPARSPSLPYIATLTNEQGQSESSSENGQLAGSTAVSPPVTLSVDEPSTPIPLFLPSPSASPAPQEIAADEKPDLEVKVATAKKRNGFPRKWKTTCYVLVPPAPDYVKQFKARAIAKERDASLDRSRSKTSRDSPTLVDEDYDYSGPGIDSLIHDDAEQNNVELSCSRLLTRYCKWSGCDAVLNCTNNLSKHLVLQHSERCQTDKAWPCLWYQCGRRFGDRNKLLKHFENHIFFPLACAYHDCDESFRTPRQLLKHHEDEHHMDSVKDAAQIFAPRLNPPPQAPKSLPFYMVDTFQVHPASISAEQHAHLVPWVMQRIAGPANVKPRRYFTHKTSFPNNRDEDYIQPHHQPYDFLTSPSRLPSTRPSRPSRLREVQKLYSKEVSEMASDDMILWDVPREPKKEDSSAAINLSEPTLPSMDVGPSQTGDQGSTEVELVAQDLLSSS